MDKKTTVAAGLGLGLFTWYALTGGNLIMQSYTAAKQGLGMAAENKRGCGCGDKTESPRIAQGSRGRRQMASEYSVGRVNPVEVEGAEDVYGAEGWTDNVKPSLKMW
tara:strand:- start:3184 stop:3504 length:321 start_codon:yes stop_codon:yes gene_type:complete